MKNKVLLILVDGMRPDGILNCGSDILPALAKTGASDFAAHTIMPSVTLPCHTSLFYSVPAERHGILDNTWHSMVRPLPGILQASAWAGSKNAVFYNWEELRDLGSPGNCALSFFNNLHQNPDSDRTLTAAAKDYIANASPDFVFLYLGETDEIGHKYGWMSPEYLNAIRVASECIGDIVSSLPEAYSVIITADHGGHGRGHGADIPEDMTIPVIALGKAFAPGSSFPKPASIMDIAPTIAKIMEFPVPSEWEGTALF